LDFSYPHQVRIAVNVAWGPKITLKQTDLLGMVRNELLPDNQVVEITVIDYTSLTRYKST